MSPALDHPLRTKEQALRDLAQRTHEDPQWRFRWDRKHNWLTHAYPIDAQGG